MSQDRLREHERFERNQHRIEAFPLPATMAGV
jgi:hypothetical protein